MATVHELQATRMLHHREFVTNASRIDPGKLSISMAREVQMFVREVHLPNGR